MPEIHIRIREDAIRKELVAIMNRIVDELENEHTEGRLVLLKLEPGFYYPEESSSFVGLHEIMDSFVYAIFHLSKASGFWGFLNRQKRKTLLMVVSEPEVYFTDDGKINLSDMKCYVHKIKLLGIVEKYIGEFADKFRIQKLRIISDAVPSRNKKNTRTLTQVICEKNEETSSKHAEMIKN